MITGSPYPACRCNACSQGRTDCPAPSACQLPEPGATGRLWSALKSTVITLGLLALMVVAWVVAGYRTV